MTAASVAPSLDYEAIGIALSLLVGAVGAVVAGAWKGWQTFKKSLEDNETNTNDRVRVVSATITETATLARLSESNVDLREAVCEMSRDMKEVVFEMRENRRAIRENTEAMARVVSAIEHNSRVIERTGIKL